MTQKKELKIEKKLCIIREKWYAFPVMKSLYTVFATITLMLSPLGFCAVGLMSILESSNSNHPIAIVSAVLSFVCLLATIKLPSWFLAVTK